MAPVDLTLYAKALSRGGHGAAHLASRGNPSLTRCCLSVRHMQRLIAGAALEICARCASTCDTDDASAFLDGISDATIHAIVTEGFEGVLQQRHVDGFARVLRPGGHAFVLRTDTDFGYQKWLWFGNAGFEYRCSIIRVASAPARKPRKKDDLARTAEFFDLYRKTFEGTVASCLRQFKTGGLRRLSAERPFSDVIRTDDRGDFLAQMRRAALPLGVGTIIDPFRLRRDEVSDGGRP